MQVQSARPAALYSLNLDTVARTLDILAHEVDRAHLLDLEMSGDHGARPYGVAAAILAVPLERERAGSQELLR